MDAAEVADEFAMRLRGAGVGRTDLRPQVRSGTGDGAVIRLPEAASNVVRLPEATSSIAAPRAAERAFDVLVAIVALVATAPLMLLVALAVRLTSRGPVLFLHERVGHQARPFRMIKFRTMYHDADRRLDAILREDPALRAEFERDFKLRRDPRITRVGRLLRRTSLDELPQFVNVLLGHMSVVGPRPIVRRELPRYGHHARDYLACRPGVTGLWQVSGRSDLDYEERIRLDVAYLRQRSLRTDLSIIVRTIPVMFFAKGSC